MPGYKANATTWVYKGQEGNANNSGVVALHNIIVMHKNNLKRNKTENQLLKEHMG